MASVSRQFSQSQVGIDPEYTREIIGSVDTVAKSLDRFDAVLNHLIDVEKRGEVTTQSIEDVCLASRSSVTLFFDVWNAFLECYSERVQFFVDGMQRACEIAHRQEPNEYLRHAIYSMEKRVEIMNALRNEGDPDKVLKILSSWDPPS